MFIPLIVIGLTAWVFGRIYINRRNRRRLIKTGNMGIARVVSVSQTGVTVNQVPQMKLVLDIEQAGAQPRRVTIKQLIDLGNIPRAGERVYVFSDPQNPDNVVLSPSASGAGLQVNLATGVGAPQPMNLDSDLIKDVMGLTPQLREHGKPGIANIVSVTPTSTSASQVVLDVDAIGTPPKRMTITQIIDWTIPSPGERVYILQDPQNPDTAALVPPSMMNGQSIPAGANRLDAVVLGPQILEKGATAKGTVVTCTEMSLNNPALSAKGFTKWQMGIHVVPDNGTPPYSASLTISLTSPEKAVRLARVGADLQLRYDPLDLQTISIDSIAMGYGNPYENARQLFGDSVNGAANGAAPKAKTI